MLKNVKINNINIYFLNKYKNDYYRRSFDNHLLYLYLTAENNKNLNLKLNNSS